MNWNGSASRFSGTYPFPRRFLLPDPSPRSPTCTGRRVRTARGSQTTSASSGGHPVGDDSRGLFCAGARSW